MVIHLFLLVLVLLFWSFVVIKLIRNKFAPVVTVEAEVVEKYRPETASNYPGTFKQKRYVVVFATKEKRLSFSVSEFSYGNYTIKEKGTLTYQGNRLISFL